MITDCTGLQAIKNNLSENYQLGNDIDCSDTVNWNSGAGFMPLGANSSVCFSGTLDGQGHNILNLVINRPTTNNVGLFGYTKSTAQIYSVGIQGGFISGKNYVGGLVGYNDGSTFNNTFTTCSVDGYSYVGGLVGQNNRTITVASARGPVTGSTYAGGLVGYNTGTITYTYATGKVSASSLYIGGLVGDNAGTITTSYTTGSVSGGTNVGGLVGYNTGTIMDAFARGTVTGSNTVGGVMGCLSGYGKIENTYATGSVTGPTNVGGFGGTTFINTVALNNYWDKQATGQSTSSGGATGKTTTQMYQQATFVSWDFNTIWQINQGRDYPKLRGMKFPVYVAQPISDQATGIRQLFSFTIPQNTIVDDSNFPITYTVTLDFGVVLPTWLTFTDSTLTLSGTPLSGEQGNYAIKVIGTNPQGVSAYDIFTLTVLNQAPIQDRPLVNQTLGIGNTLSYTFALNTFSDPDLDTLTYAAKRQDGSALPSWLSFQSQTRTFLGTPMSGAQGTRIIAVIASDGFGGNVTGLFTLTVINRPPTAQVPIGTLTATNGQYFQWVVPANAFTDLDSDPLTYQITTVGGGPLPGWLTFIVSSATLYGTPAAQATDYLQITANDGFGGQAVTTFTLVIPNTPPAVTNTFPNQDVALNTPFTFSVPTYTFFDLDGDPLTYIARLSGGGALPNWLNFVPVTITFSGTATVRASYNIQVIANDGFGGSATLNFTLRVANHAPVVTQSIGNQTTWINQLFVFVIPANTFYDSDNDTLQYQAQQTSGKPLPTWLSFTGLTRTFSGTPLTDAQGAWLLMIMVDDGFGGQAQTSFALQIPNRPPIVVMLIPNQRFLAGQPFVWTVPSSTFFDPDSDPLQLSTSSLPTGLLFNVNNQTLSGQLANNQPPFMVTVFANDRFGGSVSTRFNVSINHAPQLNGFIPNQQAYLGNPFLFTFAPDLFTDSDNDPLQYQAQQTNGNPLPTWLTFDSNAHRFIGIPQISDLGFCLILLEALDPYGGVGSGTFGVAISDSSSNQAPLVTVAIPTQTARTKILFSFQFSANTFTDPNGDVLTYTAQLEGGFLLPSWLTFTSSSRLFEGIPDQPGTVRISITANDGHGGLALTTFTLLVSDSTYYPPYVLNPISQQVANVGQMFSMIISADTFSDPNNYELTITVSEGSGLLPHWLKYDGSTRTLRGKPSPGDTDLGGNKQLQMHVTADDGQGSAITSFDLYVRGDSYLLLTIKILGPLATILGLIWSAYHKRVWLWNYFASPWYQLEPQYVIVDQLFEWTATLPKKTEGQIIHKIQAYQNNLELTNSKLLPSWLSHNEKNHQISGTPKTDDIGELNVRVYGHDGRILAALPLAAVSNQQTGDAFVRRVNTWRRMTIWQKLHAKIQPCIRCLPTPMQRGCLKSSTHNDMELSLLE